jgi:hypothetical protein
VQSGFILHTIITLTYWCMYLCKGWARILTELALWPTKLYCAFTAGKITWCQENVGA